MTTPYPQLTPVPTITAAAAAPAASFKHRYIDLFVLRAFQCARNLWPRMLQITAHEFPSNLWVKALPESGKVCCCLYRAMVWSEKMDDERCVVRTDPWSFLHPEETLHPG